MRDCPACEEGYLRDELISKYFTIGKVTFEVPDYQVSICNTCNSVITSSKQATANLEAKKRAMITHGL